jgi:hypothetical protein
MHEVTKWDLWDATAERWLHNHIDDGHAADEIPVARFPAQSGWKKGRWQRSHVYLDDNGVVHIDRAADPHR